MQLPDLGYQLQEAVGLSNKVWTFDFLSAKANSYLQTFMWPLNPTQK